MKKSEALSVGEIIQQAIAQAGSTDEYNRQRACFIWPEIVGPTINRYTTRRWVDHDSLHICISSASLKNDLAFLRQSLIDKINAALGTPAIKEIIIH